MKNQINKRSHLFPVLRNVVIIAFATMLHPSVIYSADTIWTGAGDGVSWNDPANWATGKVPTNADNTFAGRATNGGLQVANVVIGAGVSATTAALTLGHEAVTSTGTLTIEGDGSLTTNSTLLIGNYGMGSLILKDTATLIHNTSNLGGAIRPNTKGFMHVTDSASVTMNAGSFVAGERPDTAMTLIIDKSGSFTMTHNNAIFYPTYGGTHTTTGVGPTTATVKDHGVLSIASGTIKFGYSAYATGTFTLQGNATDGRGTAIARGVTAASPYTSFVFDGGILKASDSAISNFISGAVNIVTIGDGAFIDSNNRNISIANTVAITGTGGLAKLGAGMLTLNNTLGYTGTTAVNEGILVLGNADQLTASSGVTLAATGTLFAASLNQTLNNLSGAGAVSLASGTATLGGTGTSAFSGNINAASIVKNGAGTITLSGNNNIAGDSTLAEGMLNIGGVNALGSATNTLAMTGGTIQTAANVAMQNNIQVQSGALNVDSAGKTTLAGDITGAGGITKTGDGLAILSGNLSGISGNINVNQGILATGNLTGNITVANGAGFGGEGTITGNVTFTGAGILQAGFTHNDASVTTPASLTIAGNVGFGGDATLRYDMYVGSVDTITANNASFGGATNTIDLVGIQAGTFTIFKLTSGTFNESFRDSLNTTQNGGGGLGSRASATYELSADKTELLITTAKTNQVVTWTGGSEWNSTSDNWTGEDTKFVDGDKVVFNTTGNNAIAIVDTGAVASEMAITGNGSYTFTGGNIRVNKDSVADLGAGFGGTAPTGELTITTTGTVTFANDGANSFAGGIDVQRGALVGNVATLGDANIVNNGRTTFDQNIDAIYTGMMSGTGLLDKTGSSALQVGNNLSDFTGRTIIREGTFIIDNDTVYNSAFIYNNTSSAVGTALVAGDNVTISGSVRLYNGSVTIGNNARVGRIETHASAGEEPASIVIGNDSIVDGSLVAANGTGIGHVTLGVNAIVTGSVWTRAGTITIGGNSAINEGVTIWNSGSINLGEHGVVTGSVTIGLGSGSTGLGSGVLALANSSTITGSVNINSGNVLLDAGSYIGGPVTIERAGRVELQADSKINNSVLIEGSSGHVHMLQGSEISGDVIVSSTGGGYSCVGGAGKIAGNLEINGAAETIIRVATWVDIDSYSTSRPMLLEIGSVSIDGPALIMGSGTLATSSISLNNNLTLNAPSADVVVTSTQVINSTTMVVTDTYFNSLVVSGSLVGDGSVTKTGAYAAILEAPSSYTGPTSVEEGTLSAGVAGAFSPHSAFYIAPGANLSLNGHNHTLSSVVNEGRIYISGNNVPSAGAKLRIAGSYAAAGADAGIVFNIVANNNAKPLSDQLIIADAANVSGATKVFVQFTENRTHWTYVVEDLAPIIIAETGEFAPGTFVLDDGRGTERVVLSQRDYVMKYTENGIGLVATTAAEQTTALAANVVGIMASRAALGSVSQRLDYLRASTAFTGNEDTGIQTWAQTYYHADKLDGSTFPGSDGTTWGVQAGIDKRKSKTSKAGNAHTTYGAFIDRTESSATLPKKTKTDLSSTGLGGYISAHTVNNWHVDLVLRYTWDNYEIRVGDAFKYQDGDQSMTTDGYTWGAMLRTAKICDIGKGWTFAPQVQLAYQHRKIDDTTDTFGRSYAFGPEDMRLSDPASIEGRLGMSLRKLFTVNDKVSFAPYINAQFLYEFKGGATVRFINNTQVDPDTNTIVREDFGGDSYLFTLGVPVRLGRYVDIYIDASLQTGGSITGHGFNLGVNYRW